MGGDQTVVAVRRGQVVYFAMRITGPHDRQLTRIGEWLTELQRAHEQDDGPEIKIIRVDATGEGSAMPDMLAAHGWPVERVHFGGKPRRPDKFKNRRAEGYRALKEWLADGGSIPDDDYLIEELEHTEPIPGGVSGVGGATVEALRRKDEIRELLGRSPDRADALVLAVMPSVQAEARVEVW